MNWTIVLGDALIVAEKREKDSLTLFLDCSYMAPKLPLEQIRFFDYSIKEDTALTGLFCVRDRFEQVGDQGELKMVLSDKRNHKKVFRIRFSRFEVFPQLYSRYKD